jgi:hypothetical protein
MRRRDFRAWALAATALVLALAGAWAYHRYVWSSGATISWTTRSGEYELLSPRMLGLVLLAPYFVWMVGRSLADLPVAQRVMSVLLRGVKRSAPSSRST